MDKHEKRKQLIEDIEFEQDDVRAALNNAAWLWNSFGKSGLVLVLLASLLFMSWNAYSRWTTTTHEFAHDELSTETSPAGFEIIAEDYGDPAIKARALLAGADTALAEALRTDSTRDSEGHAKALQDAELYYGKLIGLEPKDVYEVNARFGLAAVAENLNEWDKARSHYKEAIQVADENNLTYLSSIAQARIEMIDQLRQPATFSPDQPASGSPINNLDLDAGTPSLDGFTLPGLEDDLGSDINESIEDDFLIDQPLNDPFAPTLPDLSEPMPLDGSETE